MSRDIDHILRSPEMRDQILGSLERDDEAQESIAREGAQTDTVKSQIESVHSGAESQIDAVTEAIIRRKGRPVLYIRDAQVPQDEIDKRLEIDLWKTRFADGLPHITPGIPAVGRVEVLGHPRNAWVGTAWLVGPNVLVTNRHVAEEFAHKAGDEYAFKLNPRRRAMRVSVDTYEENGSANETEFKVSKVLHIEGPDGPDMAFLSVKQTDEIAGTPLPEPIKLSAEMPAPGQVVGAIGYAGWDGWRNDRGVMDRIFEGVYEVKRLHPGEVMEVREEEGYLTHDCSTLGGNSGSVLVDFADGRAAALHYAGRFEDRNYAVPAATVREGLQRLGIEVA